jgi:hypothetical protein
MISSRASRSASDSTTSGASSASRRDAAKATRLIGGMMHDLASVDPIRSSVTRQGISKKLQGQKNREMSKRCCPSEG